MKIAHEPSRIVTKARLFSSFLLALASAACVDEKLAGDATSYQKDLRPLIEQTCLGCHVEGGVAPFSLTNWENVEQNAALIVHSVSTGRMPPWPVAEDCHALRDVQTLTQAERALFESWQSSGFQQGVESDYVAPERAEAPALDIAHPDLELEPSEAYVAPLEINDEYRCFLLTSRFERDTYVRAMNILPGNRQIVHHVQVHAIPGAGLAQAQANDSAEPGPGYTCFGGPNVPGSVNMFSWRPGGSAIVFEEGDAALITAGTQFVIQVHYHPGVSGTPDPDLSRVHFWTLPDGAMPERIVRRAGIVAYNLNIPVGDPAYGLEQTWPMSGVSAVGGRNLGGTLSVGGTFIRGEIIGQSPHMHALGTRLTVTKRDAAGSSACLVDVPRWDFEWQMDYLYAPSSFVSYEPGDTLTVRCEYDNTPGNQPVVGGSRLEPRNVTWGEGTHDEMCLNYVWMRHARADYLNGQRP
ncbi:MAG TPA: hypothetical protein VK524_11490 [Polyangiaceae bacterium]|nr:hypothetical protein [Polyangiaceae bacterium]